jgi:hypothetical protein
LRGHWHGIRKNPKCKLDTKSPQFCEFGQIFSKLSESDPLGRFRPKKSMGRKLGLIVAKILSIGYNFLAYHFPLIKLLAEETPKKY